MFSKRIPEEPTVDELVTTTLERDWHDLCQEVLAYASENEDICEEPDDGVQVWYRDDDKPTAKPESRRSFVFHPSFLDSYLDLQEINPEYAKIYIESLMYFGVDAYDEVPDIPIIKMALRAPFITIDKAFTNYITKRNEAANEKFKEIQARQTAKQIKEAIRLMETKQVEWEKRIKREWPYFYDR